MNDELKPCPFCAGEAELDTGQAYRALSGGTVGSRVVVYCTRCGADIEFCYDDAPGTPREDIVNQVIDDWNRRVPSPAIDAAIAALEQCQEYLEHSLGSTSEINPFPALNAALALLKGGDNG